MPRYSSRTGQLLEYQPGPFDTAHWYLQWGGKLPGGEQWSCGVRLTPKTGGPPSVTQAMCDAAATAVTNYHTSTFMPVHADAKLSIVKLNNVSTAGKQPLGVTIQRPVADVAGPVTGQRPANQVALVVSLITGFSRGPAHRGRFYLPLPVMSIQGDGRFTEGEGDFLRTTTDTFITELNTVNSEMEVAVMSRKAGAPGHRRVTGNVVGRVLDTQRRRRRSLVEDYQ